MVQRSLKELLKEKRQLIVSKWDFPMKKHLNYAVYSNLTPRRPMMQIRAIKKKSMGLDPC